MTKEIRDAFAPGHGELLCIAALGYAQEVEPVKTLRRKEGKFVLV